MRILFVLGCSMWRQNKYLTVSLFWRQVPLDMFFHPLPLLCTMLYFVQSLGPTEALQLVRGAAGCFNGLVSFVRVFSGTGNISLELSHLAWMQQLHIPPCASIAASQACIEVSMRSTTCRELVISVAPTLIVLSNLACSVCIVRGSTCLEVVICPTCLEVVISCEWNRNRNPLDFVYTGLRVAP